MIPKEIFLGPFSDSLSPVMHNIEYVKEKIFEQ